jgi:chitin synthase
MDDFSWGNTRIVVGESGKKQVMLAGEDAEVFDIKSIPHKRWSDYESELWMSDPTLGPVPAQTSQSHHGSVYGAEDMFNENMSVHSGYSSYSSRSKANLIRQSMNSVDLKRNNSTHTMATNNFPVGQLYAPNPGMQHLPPALGLPTDEEIYHEVHRILSTADLLTVTKRDVRQELSALFNVDLSLKKDWINECINQVLANNG